MGAQEDYQTFVEMAERLQLDEEEAEGFISSAMKRLGHKARQMWEDGDGSGNGDGGDFFARRQGGQRQRRPATPSRGRQGGQGGGWMYGQGS
jgi:hypothetical protein